MGGGKTKKSRRVSLRVSGHHGKGLGLGEVNVSNGGEGNGCDRCGCLDEEVNIFRSRSKHLWLHEIFDSLFQSLP